MSCCSCQRELGARLIFKDFLSLFFQAPGDDDAAGDHHFRKPANDITSQLEINFGDLGRPGRGRGGPRGGGRGARGGGPTRPPRERRPDKVGGVIV